MAERISSMSGVVNRTRVDPWAKSDEHHHHLAVNMKKRQEGHDHLLPFFENGPEGPDLSLEGDHIAMGQHGRLGKSGGAAGVGQGRQVFPGSIDLRGAGADISSSAPEKDEPRPASISSAVGGLHAAVGLAWALLPKAFLQAAEDIRRCWSGSHVSRLSARPFQVVIEDVLADHGLGLAVFDLMFDFDAGVDRADRGDLGAQP